MALTQTSKSKTLTSLALMETSLLTQDYLSTFLPFIATLVMKKNYKDINIGVLVEDFKNEFGIYIPRSPMQSILSRAVSNGLITAAQNGKYLPNFIKIQLISFGDKLNESNSSIENICNRFAEFVNQQHSLVITRDESVNAMLDFLDEFSAKAISGESDIAETDTASKKYLFLVGEFIKGVSIADSAIYEDIQKLALAHLVASALTYDLPADTRTQEFTGITIYLDTPIVLRLLGLQTDELEESYKEMLSSFSDAISPTYMVFQHTFDEVSGIISDCAKWVENPSYSPLYANPALLQFVAKKFSKVEIELYKSALSEKLIDIGITIDDKEYYNIVNQNAQIDTKKLKSKLIETYKENNPLFDEMRNDVSIDYDIRSIDNIVKLWGTKTARKYSTLGFLFITNNSTLAYVCRKYTNEYWWNSRNHKTPCVTDYYLGTMVWLSTPVQKVESFSRTKLLADCSAATTLSKEVMQKFLHELKRLQDNNGITEGDFHLIRQKAFEKNYLQNLTFNEESAFKDDTIEQLLEDIKADIQKPLVVALKKKESEIEELQAVNQEKVRRIGELEKEMETAKSQVEAEQLNHRVLAEKMAGKIINIYAPIVFAAFAFVAIILQVAPVLVSWIFAIKLIAGLVAFAAAVFFAVMKSDLLKLYTRFVKKIEIYYKVKKYKEHL